VLIYLLGVLPAAAISAAVPGPTGLTGRASDALPRLRRLPGSLKLPKRLGPLRLPHRP
jgi:hypothetical protein